MPPTDIRSAIAGIIKKCRNDKEISLDKAALLTGVSKAMLGQIERLESAPTITTLLKIAAGLNISLASFFSSKTGSDFRQVGIPCDPDMLVRELFPYDPATRMELFEVTLRNGHRLVSAAHRFGVVEHVVVLRGVVDLIHEGRLHRLEPGDVHKFHADVAHQYKAVTDSAVFHNTICYT
ncbi:helix-turn-helix domain-containing protein [Desulfovibrio sp. Fe33]|uniref:helix-turn-helix domain-containing protein n=1 Tax=Desulfovibrio sp. Fe33 TaxID=3020842 RepID=UPI00234D251F|nr:helix-turn-helix domain-containing protein [Desulfovibrio sp. Fe33]